MDPIFGVAAAMRVGDIMFGPAISAAKAASLGLIKGGAAVGAGYVGYKIWDRSRYLTPRAMTLDRHWKDFGLEKERFSPLGHKKIRPRYIREEKLSDYLYKSYFRLPIGMSINDVKEKLEAIELALDAEIDCYREGPYCVMEMSTGHLHYEETFNEEKLTALEGHELPIVIGNSKRGWQVIDLLQYPHLLVGGQTGGGKSVFIRQALVSLLRHRRPEELRMNMIDLKGGLEFQLFKEVPHVDTIAKSVWDALALLVEMNNLMNKRFELFYAAGVEKISEYNAIAEEKLPYILLTIDEFAELSPEDAGKKAILDVPPQYEQLAIQLGLFDPEKAKKNQSCTALEKEVLEKTHALTSRLLRLARAIGIHIILATQRPDAKVLPGQSKQNIPVTVAFRVRNRINSQILLDSDSAAQLPPALPGRAILQMGHIETEVQVPFLSMKEAKTLLNDLKSRETVEEGKTMDPTPKEVEKPNMEVTDTQELVIQREYLIG